MLKLFVTQRKITAVLLRGCLSPVASSGLRNTHYLKESRRSISNNGSQCESRGPLIVPPTGVIARGHYYVWSLMSNQGDSVMKLVDIENSTNPGVKCNGNFDDTSNLVKVDNASSPSIAMVYLQLKFENATFYLSVAEDEQDPEDNNYMVVTKASNVDLDDNERFIQSEYRGFSMFESFARRGGYLGCNRDGSLDLFNVYHMLQPDPRVLFLVHAYPPPSPPPRI